MINYTNVAVFCMEKINNLEQIGLVDAFNLEEDEVFEARFNLLGLFSTLQEIDMRLKKENLNNH